MKRGIAALLMTIAVLVSGPFRCGTSLLRGAVRQQQTDHPEGRHHANRVGQPAHLFLH
jgi:hypothetical protein